METETPSPQTKNWSDIIGWAFWAFFVIGLCGYGVSSGFEQSVVQAYRGASLSWLAGDPIYHLGSIHGFLYFPVAAVLGIPLAVLPQLGNDILLRALLIAWLAWSVWRISQPLSVYAQKRAFLPISTLVIIAAIGPAMAAQMNVGLAAASALIIADLYEKRWNRAAFWLALGLGLKPQMIVLLLLVGALYPSMRKRLVLGVSAFMLLPFACQSWSYVIEQHALFIDKTKLSANPMEAETRNNNLEGLLNSVGIYLHSTFSWILKVVLAPLTLTALLWATRHTDALRRAIYTAAWGATYLMLFNPRSEGGSYVIIAIPTTALMALAAGAIPPRKERWLLAFMVIGWGFSYSISDYLYRFFQTLRSAEIAKIDTFQFWLSPLLCLIFCAYLIVLGFRKKPVSTQN